MKLRLAKHNEGGSPHTAKYRPWRLVTYFAFIDHMRAAEFEAYLKNRFRPCLCEKAPLVRLQLASRGLGEGCRAPCGRRFALRSSITGKSPAPFTSASASAWSAPSYARPN
ncbi:GIY-YIG nuclease family protein [Haloferula luteola]